MEKKVLVCGSGGFIGGHLTKRLKMDGYWVRGVDLKQNEYANDFSDEFIPGDLRDSKFCVEVCSGMDHVYQLAADMGGAGYLFTGENDADIMYNSALINLNILNSCRINHTHKVFYSSSACVYPESNQMDPENPLCAENTVYPAMPDSEYGWEKLFSERLFHSYHKNYNIKTYVARFHNIFGPKGTWTGGKEKAPAAICRKVAEAKDGSDIEIWGSGEQTRSFLYIDECIEGIIRLVNSNFYGPVNIGSEEKISINEFAKMVIEISGKNLTIKHIPGPIGVMGRTSDNNLIAKELNWKPRSLLYDGVKTTYNWIAVQVANKSNTIQQK